MPQREPTLRDVAVRTGLSVTTVSQVLSDAPGRRIAEPTRRRVRAAAAELSYRPNRLAQGLRLKRTQTLGFVSDWIGASSHDHRTAALRHGPLGRPRAAENDRVRKRPTGPSCGPAVSLVRRGSTASVPRGNKVPEPGHLDLTRTRWSWRYHCYRMTRPRSRPSWS